MINLNESIEAISNGYVSTGNDSTKTKRYFESLEDYVRLNTTDSLRDLQNEIREHHDHGRTFDLKISIRETTNDPKCEPMS